MAADGTEAVLALAGVPHRADLGPSWPCRCIPGTETDIATGLPQCAGGGGEPINTITTIAIAFVMPAGGLQQNGVYLCVQLIMLCKTATPSERAISPAAGESIGQRRLQEAAEC